jgi:hypothetical protein
MNQHNKYNLWWNITLHKSFEVGMRFLTHNLDGECIKTNKYATKLNAQSTTPYAPIVTNYVGVIPN